MEKSKISLRELKQMSLDGKLLIRFKLKTKENIEEALIPNIRDKSWESTNLVLKKINDGFLIEEGSLIPYHATWLEDNDDELSKEIECTII